MSAIQIRLGAFALAIVLVALMIAWAAHSSWQKVAELSDKFTSAQIASFQTAEHFRGSLQALNFRLLSYETRHDQRDREQFLHEWNQLNDWIDVQKPTLTTPKEKIILNQIDRAYDDYFGAATNLLQSIDRKESSDATSAGFGKVDEQSQRLLKFAYNLVDAHEQSQQAFLAESQKTLRYLRALIFGSLFLLLVLGTWLAGMVNRTMINPLRMKLVETHAIIERQEKLASLGVLAAGVAHEIRNPLTAIKARLFTQQKHLEPASAERADAEIIGNEISRLERIVKD